MAAIEKQLDNKEMIDLLQHKAQEQQIGDNFRVKVKRLGGTSGYINTAPQQVCTLKDAMVVHLANPETWIPPLLGGGTYALTVYPGDSMINQIGSDIRFVHQGAPPKDSLDFDALARPDWTGPAAIIWPPRPGIQTPPSLVSLAPQAALQQGTAPQTSMPGSSLPGSQLNSQWIPSGPSFESLQIQQRERELADREMRLREESMRRETELTFAKMKADLDLERARLKAESEAFKMAAIQPKGPSVLEQLIPALAPVLTMLMQQQQSMREMMMKQQEVAQTQQNNLMQLVLARPQIDPMMQSMIDRLAPKDNTTSAEMLHSVTDTIRNMTSMAMDAVAQATEMQGGQAKDNIPMMIVKEISRAVESFGNMGGRAVMARQPMPPPRPVQLRPIPGSAAAPLPQGQPQQPPPGNGAVATGQQTPAFNGVPSQTHQQAVQQVQAQAAIPQHIMPRRAPNGDLSFNSVPDALEYLVRLRDEPTKIISFLRDNLQDPTLQAEFARAGGVIQLFEQRLGRAWLQSDPVNHPYMQNLIRMIQDELQRLGIVPAGTQEQEEEDGPEDAQYADQEDGVDDVQTDEIVG